MIHDLIDAGNPDLQGGTAIILAAPGSGPACPLPAERPGGRLVLVGNAAGNPMDNPGQSIHSGPEHDFCSGGIPDPDVG